MESCPGGRVFHFEWRGERSRVKWEVEERVEGVRDGGGVLCWRVSSSSFREPGAQREPTHRHIREEEQVRVSRTRITARPPHLQYDSSQSCDGFQNIKNLNHLHFFTSCPHTQLSVMRGAKKASGNNDPKLFPQHLVSRTTFLLGKSVLFISDVFQQCDSREEKRQKKTSQEEVT